MKLSIITSTYNRAGYFLPRAIKSVLRQDLDDFEYLIIDDCSTDNTEEVVKSFKDDRIRYIKLPKNFGSDTRPKNVGLKEAKGEYVCFLDDDCAYRLGALRILSRELDKGEADVVYGDMWLTGEIEPQIGIAHNFDAQFLLMRNYIDTSEAMLRKDWAFKVGGWDERLPKFVDWNFWVRLMKAGARFQRMPYLVIDYTVHKDTKSAKVETRTYYHPQFGTLFEPTFDPPGCYWWVPYLGTPEPQPKVAIFTLTYDRLDFTQNMLKSMTATADYPFDWFVVDNGSQDKTPGWLKKKEWAKVYLSDKNLGISGGSNKALEMIELGDYQIIGKVDNDCEFQTKGWLKDIIDLWKRNRMLYISPYPEGLIANPGGGARVGYAEIGPYFIEVSQHLGGLCAFVDSEAYKGFRWNDKFLHGNQDSEASLTFRKKGYMPLYLPRHRVMHNTDLQMRTLPDYFERRKVEKTTQYEA